MKPIFKRFAVGLLVQVLVFGGFAFWISDFYGPSVLILGWPGLLFALWGVSHSWIIAGLILLGIPLMVALTARHRSLLFTAGAGTCIFVTYCFFAWELFLHAPLSRPTATPFDAKPQERAEYLSAYDRGYRMAIVGRIPTCCFAPKAETRGHYDGQTNGIVVFNRFLGRKESFRNDAIENAAARDGVEKPAPAQE